jgi:molybdopterin/thiamine biosynthesis adenylyltransferase
MISQGALSNFPEQIHLIGVGGIGSVVLPPLMRMAPQQVVLWDHDHVESHNLDYQLIYRPEDVGRPKVEAALSYLERQGLTDGTNVTLRPERVTSSYANELSGIVIMAVDSMEARLDIFKAVCHNSAVLYMLDGRTGGSQFDCFCIEPCNLVQVDFYQGLLFPDSQAAPLPCGGRDDSESAGVVGRVITRAVRQYVQSVFDANSKPLPVVRVQLHLDSMQIDATRLSDITPQGMLH